LLAPFNADVEPMKRFLALILIELLSACKIYAAMGSCSYGVRLG
jgi:hypothetical protein